jgi:hypothetical protein
MQPVFHRQLDRVPAVVVLFLSKKKQLSHAKPDANLCIFQERFFHSLTFVVTLPPKKRQSSHFQPGSHASMDSHPIPREELLSSFLP